MRVLLYFAITFAAKFVAVVTVWPHSAAGAVFVFVSPELWLLYHLLAPNAQGLGPVCTAFATTRREVWLTIDDGPDPATTPRVLDLLESHGARATFFVIGERAQCHPALVREIVRRGHAVANHTHTHPLVWFWFTGPRRTAREIDTCAAALRSAGVEPARWFRPPAGIKNVFLFRLLTGRRLALIGWSARGRETTSRNITAPLARLKRGVRPGAILLTHEAGTADSVRFPVLAHLLAHLHAEGYTCVLPPADRLLSRPARAFTAPVTQSRARAGDIAAG
jgi:peptidoglycan/xylan/chitin deacetylase (PgdA/CDA1 family)